MTLTVQPIKRFGLNYYAVVTLIGGVPAELNTFMSPEGAHDYVNRLRNSINGQEPLFVIEGRLSK